VELQEDWRDQPSGKQLVAGKITLESAGQAVWATLLFPQPVVLPSHPAWLIVKALSGRAVWLANTGTTQVHLLERSDEQTPWSLLNVLEAVQPLYMLISRNNQAQAQPAVTLAIGKTIVVQAADQNGAPYNLAPALSAYIAGQPPDSPVTLPLAFTSGLPGLITVYPPQIEYDLQ